MAQQLSAADMQLSKEQQAAIIAAKDAYDRATTDEERRAAHAEAERIRQQAGNYSGGTSGDEYIDLSQPSLGNGGSSGSSGSGTTIKVPENSTPQNGTISGGLSLNNPTEFYSTKQNGGKYDQNVQTIQQALIQNGYGNLLGNEQADGYYGQKTANAIMQYQRDKGLDVDGVAGVNTLTSLGLLQAAQNTGDSTVQETIKTEVVNQGTPTDIWKAVKAPDGTIQFEKTSGYNIIGDDGTGRYTYEDGSELGNGDAVLVDDEYLYYDAETGALISADDWNSKYGQKDPSKLSQEELITLLYDTLFDRFSEPEQLEDFLTWAEAQDIARERYNPIYHQALDKSLTNIDQRALASGFYGQLPTEALKQQAAASAEVEKATAINELAQALMGDSREFALQKLDANLSEKKVDIDTLLNLLNLANTFNDNGSTTGAKGNISAPMGGSGITANGSDTGSIVGNVANQGTSSQKPAQPSYNNGNLNNDQVKVLQGVLGVGVDGLSGTQTQAAFKKLGFASADDAYNTLVEGASSQGISTTELEQYVADVITTSMRNLNQAQTVMADKWNMLAPEQRAYAYKQFRLAKML